MASQEQHQSARGLAKAFREVGLNVPAVIRIGGNAEEAAIRILMDCRKELSAPLEAYGRDTDVDYCVSRLAALVEEHRRQGRGKWQPDRHLPARPSVPEAHAEFETLTGRISWRPEICRQCDGKACVAACPFGILRPEEGVPVLAIGAVEAKRGRCTECLACELACPSASMEVILPIPGLTD